MKITKSTHNKAIEKFKKMLIKCGKTRPNLAKGHKNGNEIWYVTESMVVQTTKDIGIELNEPRQTLHVSLPVTINDMVIKILNYEDVCDYVKKCKNYKKQTKDSFNGYPIENKIFVPADLLKLLMEIMESDSILVNPKRHTEPILIKNPNGDFGLLAVLVNRDGVDGVDEMYNRKYNDMKNNY